jgi:hypothetical protein
VRSKAFGDLFAPPDPAIVEAGAGGERLIARTRVIFWGTIWLIPVVTLLTMEAAPPEVRISFIAASLGLLISFLLMPVVRRNPGQLAVAAATSAFDITIITVTLLTVALAGRPLVAINSLVIWPIYEELVLILPDTDRAGAVRHVNRIRERLAQTPLEVVSDDVRITVSIGVAEFPTDGRDGTALTSAADRRLLEAKRRGRNRVVAED